MHPALSVTQGAFVKSVYVNSYKMFIVYQDIIVAVATASVLLVKPCLYVALAIISVVLFGYLQP